MMGCEDRTIAKSNLYERVSKLLNSYEWSDCSFSVAGSTFKAHRLILGICSPVFKAMLYGPMAADKAIVVEDIEPEVFQLMLNYIYTDKVTLNSIQEAFGLMYAAKKYMLEYLTEKCIDFIDENTSIDNVITVFNFSDYMQEEKLISRSLMLICEHADLVLHKNPEDITLTCLKALLEADKINMKEKDLIKVVLQWSKLFCEEIDVPVTVENRRKILIENGILKLLRFLTLTTNDFEELSSTNELLLTNEVDFIRTLLNLKMKLQESALAKDFIEDKNVVLCPVLSAREIPRVSWYFCHRSPIRSAAPLVITEHSSNMQMRVKSHKTIFVYALCVPTRMSPQLNFITECPSTYSEHFSISIKLDSSDSSDRVTNFMNMVDYDSTVCVDFAEPYILKRDEWYRITFTWPDNRAQDYKYLVSYRNNTCYYKTKFEFDDISINPNGVGSFIEGLKFSV